MRLKAFRVKHYKTIVDSGRVEIPTTVTCLMGKNEAGKSAVLQALWKFNNVANTGYDRLLDLPAEQYAALRHTDPEVVVLEFALDDEDRTAFLSEFPAFSSLPETITVRSTYDKRRTLEIQLVNIPATYGTIATRARAVISALKTLESDPRSSSELPQIAVARATLEALDAAGNPDKAATEIQTSLIQNAVSALQVLPKDKMGDLGKGALDTLVKFASQSDPEVRTKAEGWFLERLPIFIYFEDYGRLRTRIHLPDFVQSQPDPSKDQEQQLLQRTQGALLEWVHLDAGELQRLGQPKHPEESQDAVSRRKDERARILESASYSLSGDWLTWWDQRIHQLHLSADGDELELRVSDNINPWKIAFGERSRGFQWFFSFYLTFLVESEKAHRGAIILLDEPGLHLHPSAQEKLLSFFQRVADDNQIIYSSHSMFMVDPNHLDDVRTVYLSPKDKNNARSRSYTQVSKGSEPQGDRDTLLPLHAAGAYQLAQTIFLGKRTLVMPGIKDYWLLQGLSNYLSEHGGGALHEDTTLLWAGGTSHFLPLASILSAREESGPNRIAILFDGADANGTRGLVETLARSENSIILLQDALEIPRAQTEDLLEFEELRLALNQTGHVLPTISEKRTGETNGELLQRIFSNNHWGELTDKIRARMALQLTDSWRTRASIPENNTLDRAKKLFSFLDGVFQRLAAETIRVGM